MKSVENSYALASSVRDLNCRGIHLRWSFSLLLFDQKGSSAESGSALGSCRARVKPWIGIRAGRTVRGRLRFFIGLGSEQSKVQGPKSKVQSWGGRSSNSVPA